MFFTRKEQPRKICREKGNIKIWGKRSQEYAWAREERNLTKTRKRRDSKAIRMHHGVARVHSPTSQRHSSMTPLFTLTLGQIAKEDASRIWSTLTLTGGLSHLLLQVPKCAGLPGLLPRLISLSFISDLEWKLRLGRGISGITERSRPFFIQAHGNDHKPLLCIRQMCNSLVSLEAGLKKDNVTTYSF